MRSAFNSDDPSLLIRLENQQKLRTYMWNKPFGVGIGMSVTSNFAKYKPDPFVSKIPSDSWYVRVWMETGIVGLIIHLINLLFIVAYGAYVVYFKIKNTELKGLITAFVCGLSGVYVAAYSLEIIGQFPTSFIMFMCMTLIFRSKIIDNELEASELPANLKIMADSPDISIITVNFNGINHTRELLNSIEDFLVECSYEVIVVDNGSVEDEATILATEFKQHKFIRSQKNLGFSGGNNLGIKASSGKYIYLVNNDTLFVDNSIGKLMQTFENDPYVGAVSPKIYYQDSAKIIQFAGFTEFSQITIRNSIIGNKELDCGQYDSLSETASAHGAAMMVKREVIDKIGLMPEIYFLYYEEHDWCGKNKKAGLQNYLPAICHNYS